MVELSKTSSERPATASRIMAPREEVRDALLDAVGKLIHQYGYRKTSVEDIAQEAGVSRATAYLYFAGKEALVMGWIERKDREFLEFLEKTIQIEASVQERIFTFLLTRIMARFDQAQVYMHSVPGMQNIDEILAALRLQILTYREQQTEAEAAVLAEVIREGIERKEIRASDDPLTTARLMVLSTNAFSPSNLSQRLLGERDEVEARVRGLISLLLAGLRYAEK